MWVNSIGVVPSDVLAAGNVNGDGKADPVPFARTQGKVFFTFQPQPFGQCYTATSLGYGMDVSVLWREKVTFLCADTPFAGDANGDGRADIIVFAQSEGKVYVSLAP